MDTTTKEIGSKENARDKVSAKQLRASYSSGYSVKTKLLVLI